MKSKKILLVEPAYRSKYPPLGLMKISAYHKKLGDEVTFVKGCSAEAASERWDRVYITTLFSFDWNLILKTINFYKKKLPDSDGKIRVGGIAASILSDKILKETGIKPIVGRLDQSGILDSSNSLIVDEMVPDYSILDQVEYEYPCSDAYIGYATRGCIRKCRFCAVPKLEPEFLDYIDIKPWVEGIRKKHGEKQHLMLLDNNVLASPNLAKIAADIKALGFIKEAKRNKKARHVDFNQGMDARLLTAEHMDILADIPINPFRLAYDNVKSGKYLEQAVRLAAKAGFRNFTSYLLYNFTDKPTELWDRIHHCVQLSEELDIQITSFPMKYIPVTNTDRRYISPNWNRRFLRSIQCILLVTKGVVSARHDFFHVAFGTTHKEFIEILSMPDNYIINRSEHKNNGAANWLNLYGKLNSMERGQLLEIVSNPAISNYLSGIGDPISPVLQRTLAHYIAVR